MSMKLYSSLTKKYIMSLAGLFLLTFLLVHLTINLLLLFDDSRGLFKRSANFMGTNTIIQTFQWVLFGGFAIHMLIGCYPSNQNWMARPKRYNKKAISEDIILFKVHDSYRHYHSCVPGDSPDGFLCEENWRCRARDTRG